MSAERMAWSGACDTCLAGVIVYPTPDQQVEVQQELSETWPRGLAECPTADCDGTVDWNGSDPIGEVLAQRLL